ncbi:MAG: glycogen debranching protein GlgX [Planctomycetaceae bacterium]|jgi:glycogen operon protein|nr:glycogen debranching protein GlgX [Planctomycetaceae bacterium]
MFLLPLSKKKKGINEFSFPASRCKPLRLNTPYETANMIDPTYVMRFTYPLPCGAILRDNGVQFVVVSRCAASMKLLLYNKVTDLEPSEIIQFNKEENRRGNVWSLFVGGLKAKQLYHFQADGPFELERGQRFDGRARLIDPYAKALAGTFQESPDGIIRPPKCVVIDDDDFDWRGDKHLRHDFSKSIIYELHVKGFTASPSGNAKYPGTYPGLIERIPYLQELGITAVELMPIHEFPILGTDGKEPRIKNYWGYDTMAFFSPHRGYAYGKEPGAQVREFKEMVRAFHQAGIEVILDVVFNHTCEGNEYGPTLSFKGLDNPIYYMLEHGQYYKNYSGCGNTVNGNHPIVREMIFNCLRYWVHNYHIDGFRFDLASILSRDQSGNLQANPPLIEQISEDPLLADTKIIAEAWDAAGAYQVGSFGAFGIGSQRWAEWNGKYRDDIRRFWRGDQSMTGAMATRLSGSSDLYSHSGRDPQSSINFITAHDGFTMNDLVSYNYKHNEENGEGNRDGENNNCSCNYGIEGPAMNREIEETRCRQVKNMIATLLLSQGVPMISAGDEVRRTQRGNNNAYCQDNAVSWFDWKDVKKHSGILRFAKELIRFRRKEATVRQPHFLTGQARYPGGLPDISWYGAMGGGVQWNQGLERSLSCLLSAVPPTMEYEGSQHHLLMMFHGGWEPKEFYFPAVCQNFMWRLFADTAESPPNDIYPDLRGPKPNLYAPLKFLPHSLRVYLAATK